MTHRPLCDIAREIQSVWPKPYFGAVPYLSAMLSLDQIGDNFYQDSGEDIVLYFLSNATTFRGEDARRIKAELREIVK
jgi:hypothetical protein